MNEKYDVTQISGYENMDEEDKKYFERYGNYIIDQTEKIAQQVYIDPNSMEDDFEQLINSLTEYDGEYIVEGAPLTCSMCTREVQYFKTPTEIITSVPFYSFNLSKLRIPEDRKEEVNDLKPAIVTDTLGGSRECKVDKELNIISFGNCQYAKDYDFFKTLASRMCKEFRPFEREAEIQRLTDRFMNEIKKEKGTCYCLMHLRSKWENFPSDYVYEQGNFNYKNLEYDGAFNSYMEYNGEEKINMLSMLFCIRGGIIRPINSGQTLYLEDFLKEPDINDPEQVKHYMMRFFLSKGLSCEIVAGILGNVEQECHFDLPEAAENKSMFGLFQFDSNRQVKLNEWAAERGVSINLVSTQCGFAYDEMQKSFTVILDLTEYGPKGLLCNWEELLKADSYKTATLIFATYYERCYTSYKNENGILHYDNLQEIDKRIGYAENVYAEIKKIVEGPS